MQTVMNTKFKIFKNQKGMTLIELLAVIVVLGIIAAIAIPAIGSTVDKSKTKSDAQNVVLITAAAERYANDANPTGSSTGVPLSAAVITIPSLVTLGYLQSTPLSAVTGKAYKDVVVTYSATAGWAGSAVSITP